MTLRVVVNDRWTTVNRLGAGTFGEVYCGTDKTTGERVAIKLEVASTSEGQLKKEYTVYKALGMPGLYFPEIYHFDTVSGYNAMVMQLLGPSLEDVFQMCKRKFTLKTVTMIGLQMIKRLKQMHRSDYIHRDLKPDNLCIGTGAMDTSVFVVDLGLAKRFKDVNRYHIQHASGKRMMGTARYASIHAHKGHEQSRRDDLEALGYILVYLFRGSLPWQGLRYEDKDEKYHAIYKLKKKTSRSTLVEGMPRQFREYFKYVDSLDFKDKPDYEKLEKLLMAVLTENGLRNDNQFDWLNNQRYKLIKPTRLPKPIVIAPPPPPKPVEKKKRKTKSQRKLEARAAGIPIASKPKYISKALREQYGITVKHLPRGTTLAQLGAESKPLLGAESKPIKA